MLHIIKQYKNLFTNLVESKLTQAENRVLSKADRLDGEKDGFVTYANIKKLDKKLADKVKNLFGKDLNENDLLEIDSLRDSLKTIKLETTHSKSNLSNQVISQYSGRSIEQLDNRFTAIAKKIDSNGSGNIGKTEIKKYISQISDQNMKAAISHAWNENWKTYGSKGIPVNVFAGMIEEKYNSNNAVVANRVSKKITSWKEKSRNPENYSSDEVINQINITQQSVLNFREALLVTKKLNGKISDYLFRERSGYSIEALIRKLTGNDKYRQIVDTHNQYVALFSNPENRKKLERALAVLSSDNVKGVLSERKGLTEKGSETFNKILKILPWLFGLYLGDIPLPFVKYACNGADIDKAVPFKNWIKDGMNGEFEDYLRANKKDINVLKNQFSLRSMISSLGITSREKRLLIAGKLDQLTENTRQLIKDYIRFRLIPDLKILNRESYNIFERGFLLIFSDSKYDKGEAIIKQISENLKNGVSDLSIADQIFDLLKQEGDVDVSTVEGRNIYMKDVQKNNNLLDDLSTFLKEKGLSDFIKLYKYDSLDDVKKLGATASDKRSLDRLEILLNPIDVEGLKRFKRKNPSTMKFIRALGNKKLMQKYLSSHIPTGKKLKYIEVGKSKHGRNLSRYSNEEALRIAESETPVKNSKISTLGYAYRSFINKGNIKNVSYNDFRKAFLNKQNISLDNLGNQELLNTGRNKGESKITNISKLKLRGDKTIFKLAPIKKDITFYSAEGKKVNATITYQVYMRPDCSNPILLNDNVIIESKSEIPNMPKGTQTFVNGKFSVVISWSILKKLTKQKQIHHKEKGHIEHHPAKTHEVDLPNTKPDVDNTPTDIDTSVVDSGNASGNPAGDAASSSTSISNTVYNTKTVVDVPAWNEYIIDVPSWIETITYTVGKSAGQKLAESFIGSLGASLTQEAISQNLIQCAKDNNIKPEDLDKFIKYDIPKIIKKGKNLQRPKSDPIQVPYSNANEVMSIKKYTVKSGDTLSSIAKKFNGISYIDIANKNNIKKPYKIYPGQSLEIPTKK